MITERDIVFIIAKKVFGENESQRFDGFGGGLKMELSKRWFACSRNRRRAKAADSELNSQ
jgi:hypothetical protein